MLSFKKIFITFITLLFSHAVFALSPVNYGDPSVAYLSPAEEQKLGKEMMAQIRDSGLILDDPVVEDYIAKFGRQLVLHSNAPNSKITFFILNSPEINAFTGPAGYIGVNTGLVTFVKNQNQLAAVLAHEISHVTQRHLARMFQLASQSKIPTFAAALASIALGVVNPMLGAGALSATLAGYQQNLINFTRANEWEADRIGMGTLYRAGYDPKSMPLMFAELQRKISLNPDDEPALLRSHPVDSDRIADSMNRARQYPQVKSVPDLQFALIQSEVRVDTTEVNSDLYTYFQTQSHLDTMESVSLQYGYVLSLIKLKRYAEAENQLAPLLKQSPQQILFQLAAANIKDNEKDYSGAMAILKNAMATHPNYYPAKLNFALTVFDSGNYQQAQTEFQNLVWAYPKRYKLYNYLAESQAKNGDLQSAYMSRAKMLDLLGNHKDAIQLLKVGLRSPGKNPYGKIQIEARLKQLEKNHRSTN